MKTLADLKRDLQIGDAIITTKNDYKPGLVGQKRYIVKKQGNGVFLNADKNATKGSFLEFKNAKLIEYDGEYIRTYTAGNRPMTSEEARVFANMPSKRKENEERIKMEIMTDTNGSWYMDKAYLKEHGMPYLMTCSNLTKRINYSDKSITDEQVKGNLDLEYKIERNAQ
jgi:hypothetical protein